MQDVVLKRETLSKVKLQSFIYKQTPCTKDQVLFSKSVFQSPLKVVGYKL